MREKKIVLFVVGDEHIWSGCYSVIQEVLFEYHVKYVDNYVAAYKIIVENNIDVMIEDSPRNINDISRKVKVIKYYCKYNEDVEGANIITAYSWWHIYDLINKLNENI